MAFGRNWRKSWADEVLKVFDPISHSVTAISEDHRMIHDEMAYTLTLPFTALAAAGNKDILIDVPAACYPHLRKIEANCSDGPFTLYVYEGTTVSANGTAKTPVNNNRNSAETAEALFYEGPTVTGAGTAILTHNCYSSGAPGVASSAGVDNDVEFEFVLAPSTKYLIRLNNGNAGAINGNIHLFFYEPEYAN